MPAHLPKAVLYYNPASLWSTAALLALSRRKGYSGEEFELKAVELGKGEHLSLSFLRINPKGTVPTLVVPLERTLSPEDEHRFKAITDTKSVVDFLDKSRSATSRTHTVSSAPAPALAPATIGMSATSTAIIDLVHSEDDAPLLYFGAATLPQLQALAQRLTAYFRGQLDAINECVANSQAAQIQASEKTRKLWESRKARAENLLAVFTAAGKADAQLTPDEKEKRDAYLKAAQEIWHVKVRKILVALDKEMVGPLALGDQISVADLHLGPWLARVAALCGASASDAGDAVIAKIEQRIGDNFVLPKDFQTINVNADPSIATTPGAKRAKLAAFWDEIRGRPSWKKVYGDQLH